MSTKSSPKKPWTRKGKLEMKMKTLPPLPIPPPVETGTHTADHSRCPRCMSDSRKLGNMVPCENQWHTLADHSRRAEMPPVDTAEIERAIYRNLICGRPCETTVRVEIDDLIMLLKHYKTAHASPEPRPAPPPPTHCTYHGELLPCCEGKPRPPGPAPVPRYCQTCGLKFDTCDIGGQHCKCEWRRN